MSNKKYKINNINVAFNQYTLEALEFLSIGVFIDFNLLSIDDKKTEISIEVRRKIGSFDHSHEVTNANEHITKLTNLMSDIIILTDDDFNSKYLSSIEKNNKKWWEKNSIFFTVTFISIFLWILLPFTLYGLYKRLTN